MKNFSFYLVSGPEGVGYRSSETQREDSTVIARYDVKTKKNLKMYDHYSQVAKADQSLKEHMSMREHICKGCVAEAQGITRTPHDEAEQIKHTCPKGVQMVNEDNHEWLAVFSQNPDYEKMGLYEHFCSKCELTRVCRIDNGEVQLYTSGTFDYTADRMPKCQ